MFVPEIAHNPKATSDPQTQRIDCVDTIDGKAEFRAVYKLVRVEKVPGKNWLLAGYGTRLFDSAGTLRWRGCGFLVV
jgi:hypothetical protein